MDEWGVVESGRVTRRDRRVGTLNVRDYRVRTQAPLVRPCPLPLKVYGRSTIQKVGFGTARGDGNTFRLQSSNRRKVGGRPWYCQGRCHCGVYTSTH